MTTVPAHLRGFIDLIVEQLLRDIDAEAEFDSQAAEKAAKEIRQPMGCFPQPDAVNILSRSLS